MLTDPACGNKTAAVIVTHNSQAVLGRCLAALSAQTAPPVQTALIDSGSEDTAYLQPYVDKPSFIVRFAENIGFSRANNIGWQAVRQEAEAVLFLNPDAFPAPESLELACAFLAANPAVGCVGGRL
ncbi:glycosyltransferase family 2 protein, partial [Candidatus Electronema sp. TJ]|uniref:glycosyltransferase family 2 protein n=1 Tax=Candidatus Electronema sp. TJ TaxID=3401573 RepID=UPI003AA8AA14